MPIWLRNLTYNLIADQKRKESEAYSKNYSSKNDQKIDFANPKEAKNIMRQSNPTYVTKASKK